MNFDNLKKYIGEKVLMFARKEDYVRVSKGITMVYPMTTWNLDPNDTIIAKITAEASDAGMNTRVVYPDTAITFDRQFNRLNIYIKELADKTFEIVQIDNG